MRMRKKKNLAPRMEACGMYLIKDPFSMRGRWRELMPAAGSCGWSWAAARAASPTAPLQRQSRMCCSSPLRWCRTPWWWPWSGPGTTLRNVWFVDGDAALLPDMFAQGEIDRLYINFCDPWPKSNQKKTAADPRELS